MEEIMKEASAILNGAPHRSDPRCAHCGVAFDFRYREPVYDSAGVRLPDFRKDTATQCGPCLRSGRRLVRPTMPIKTAIKKVMVSCDAGQSYLAVEKSRLSHTESMCSLFTTRQENATWFAALDGVDDESGVRVGVVEDEARWMFVPAESEYNSRRSDRWSRWIEFHGEWNLL